MTSVSTPMRRRDVDALRALAVLLLIVFHTARLFDAEPWHMKDLAAPYWTADLLVRLLNIWQMPLLFLLAGMGAAWALERRSAGAFAMERGGRLLVPLVIGMAVLVAPQVWAERVSPDVPLRMSPIDFDGGPVAFAGAYFRCCYPQANLSWHHLWFLPYLFVYSMALLTLARGAGAPRLAGWVAGAAWRLALPALLLIGLELALRPAFPSTHNLIWDWANHAHYGLLVVLGWWFARNPALEAAVDRAGAAAVLAAIGLTALWLLSLREAQGGFAALDLPWAVRLGLRIGAEWATLLSLLAIGRRFLDRSIPGLAFFAPLALAFYVLHQTIIVMLGWGLVDWSGQPALKFATIAALATVASLALAWAGSRSAPTRWMLGLRAPAERGPSLADQR